MLDAPRGFRVIVLATIALCIIATLTGARGQEKNGGAFRVANIDIARLQGEYNAIQIFNKDLSSKEDALQSQIQSWQQNALLSEADQKTLADLTIKEKNGTITPAEKGQQQKLQDQSKKLTDDYSRLQGTAIGAITNQDKEQLNTYVKLVTDTDNRATVAKQRMQDEIRAKVAETSDMVKKAMKSAVEKVAKEKNFSVIFTTDVAPYAEYDCTDDVLKILNKK